MMLAAQSCSVQRMSTPILHHYPSSPFSEKIRVLFGYKGLGWQSVTIPAVMPKPDVIALTGGYRKTPILQVGCDVFCDTRLIARVVDNLGSGPTIYPRGAEATANLLAQWADQTLFYSALPYAFSPSALTRTASALKPEEAQVFMQDRLAMNEDARYKPPSRYVAMTHMPVYLAELEAQLVGNTFLCAAVPTIADFAVYHCLWFIERSSPQTLAPYPHVCAWMAKIAGFGHGTSQELSSGEALALCRASTPRPLGPGAERDPNGIARGARVVVRTTDIGRDPIEGELIFIDADELVLRRVDERAGTVHVHFPRVGYEMKAA
jgi:glutathione S-transferase